MIELYSLKYTLSTNASLAQHLCTPLHMHMYDATRIGFIINYHIYQSFINLLKKEQI